jgi:hypothetical protein
VALAEVLALALALVEVLAVGVVEADEEDEEDEEDELLQPAAASPRQATPSSAASRVDEVLGISTPTTIATTGCAVQQRQTALSATRPRRPVRRLAFVFAIPRPEKKEVSQTSREAAGYQIPPFHR